MKTAAAYIRVSTDDQIEYSPESQLKAIQKYAKEHEMILPEEFVFVDEGISGRKAEKRPSFQQMIATAKIKPKPFDVILLWKFSRFARNRQDSIVYKSMLRKDCGIDVLSISEQLSEDGTSILVEALIEAMDEYYSVNLAGEVKRGMTERFSRGEIISSAPFGYEIKDGLMYPDNTTASFVKMIYNDYLSGIGTRQIAMKLNDLGIRKTNGNLFEKRNIDYILANPTYTGKLWKNKSGKRSFDLTRSTSEDLIIVEGKHEPIIPEDLFEKAQKKRAETKQLFTKYSRPGPSEFMLRGLVKCDSCGSTLCLITHREGKQLGLQCNNYAKGKCKVSHFIQLKKLNKVFMEKLKSDTDKKVFNISIESTPSETTLPDVSGVIEREKKKLVRVREAYEAGVDTLEEYKQNKLKIQARIDELTNQIKEAGSNSPEEISMAISERIQSGLKILESTETSETIKNMTLRTFIDKIVYFKAKNIIEIFYKL